MAQWFEVSNSDQILSPALLFYPERIKTNIQLMISIAGSADRLRPHVKTYKCKEVVAMQMEAGISKFKCATLTEARMLAETGVKDILIAYPLVDPNQIVFGELIKEYPAVVFSTLIDHKDQIKVWKNIKTSNLNIYIDINVGMNRTGILPENAFELYSALTASSFNFKGLHVYDGHIHEKNKEERRIAIEKSFEKVKSLIDKLEKESPSKIEVICGGSVSFPIHAENQERQLSPGTTLLWDYGYASQFEDLAFDEAAVVMARIISKPCENKLCLDLGHKAVASEMSHAPVFFPQIPDAKITTLSEEHMVIESAVASNWSIGDVIYGFPWHICPTVALHEQAAVVIDHEVKKYWTIVARKRKYQI